VRHNTLPFETAQWFSSKKAGALGAMLKLNPTVGANKWKGWTAGAEVLFPIEWGDPTLKGPGPVASGSLPSGGGSTQQPSQGSGGGASSGTVTPWGNFIPGQTIPGTAPIMYPGAQAFPVPVSSSSPAGFIYGPPWQGKWTPPSPGGFDIDNGITPALFTRSN
jgi:hypothetical protein